MPLFVFRAEMTGDGVWKACHASVAVVVGAKTGRGKGDIPIVGSASVGVQFRINRNVPFLRVQRAVTLRGVRPAAQHVDRRKDSDHRQQRHPERRWQRHGLRAGGIDR